MPGRKQPISTDIEPRAEWVDWSQIGSPNHQDEKLRYVRLIHKPISFFKYHINGKSAIVADPSNNPVAVKHGIKPLRRYAINIIDRATKTVKILEGAELLFLHFRWFYEMTGIDPGGLDACDFEINVNKGNGKVTYEVKYDISVRTPFTEEEKLLLREGFFDLPNVFRPMPQDEVERRLGLSAR
jgi:hypothetical protein